MKRGKGKFANLPRKPKVIVPKDKSVYIRQQFYNPDKENKIGFVIIDRNIHQEITDNLRKLGLLEKSYYVGGIVRDSLMGNKSYDIDIVVEKPSKRDIEILDKNFERTGKDFPVYRMVLKDGTDIEIALARKEYKVGKGHKGFETITGEDISIVDDLYRRDITINAMAVSIKDPNKLIDPFNGKKDLELGIIRHVSEAFKEDPLRVFRVARFGARFEFKVADETLQLMRELKGELKDLSSERVFMEVNKMFAQSRKPSIFFEILKKADVLDTWFPEINKMIGIPQRKDYHPEGDVYVHTLMVIDNLSQLGASPKVLWGGLFHDVGKIDTPKEILPKHIGHEKRGLKYVDELAQRYRWSREIKKIVRDSIEFHLLIPRLAEMKPSKIIQNLERLYKNGTLDDVVVVAMADRMIGDREFNQRILEIIKVAKEVLSTNLPEHIQEKIRSAKDTNKIKDIILNFRVNLFRQLMV